MNTNNINNTFTQNNYNRTYEINDRIASRIVPSTGLNPVFFPHPVKTRQVLMPMVDCRKDSNVNIVYYGKYNVHKDFTPGYRAPIDGYSPDDESKLKNIIFPLQSAPQSKFIPSSKSSLYTNEHLVKSNHVLYDPHIFLQRQFDFSSKTHDPAAGIHLGKKTFYNSERQHVKHYPLSNKSHMI